MNAPNDQPKNTRIELRAPSPKKNVLLAALATAVVVGVSFSLLLNAVLPKSPSQPAPARTIAAACATPRDLPPLATPVSIRLNDAHGDDLVTLDVALSPNYKTTCDVRITSQTHPVGATTARQTYFTLTDPIAVNTGRGYSHSGTEVTVPDQFGLTDATANLDDARGFTVKLHVVRSDGAVTTIIKNFTVYLAADGRPALKVVPERNIHSTPTKGTN